jgi:hypothetical protein
MVSVEFRLLLAWVVVHCVFGYTVRQGERGRAGVEHVVILTGRGGWGYVCSAACIGWSQVVFV